MNRLTQLLWHETSIWPWNLQNQGPDVHRIKISNKKFHLEIRVYSTRLEIERLIIPSRYRGRKLGTAIVTALKKFADEEKLNTQVNYPLAQSVKFWEKMRVEKNILVYG